MRTPGAHRPELVLSWGNPSRGDDAIGPELHNMLQAAALPGVDLLTDFQLQIEHCTDLEGRQRVLFIDASLDASPPFDYHALQAEKDNSFTTHALSPAALLALYQQVHGGSAPGAHLLSVRGYNFGLGEPLSPMARNNLQHAFDFILEQLRAGT